STQTSNSNYLATAYMIARPTEMMSTATQNNTQIRVYQAAGSVMMFVQFGWFPTNWAVGDILRCRVTLISTGEYTEWEYLITTPSGTITVTNPVQILPAPVYNLSGSITGTEDLFNVIVSCPTAYLNQSVTTGTDGLFNFIIRYWDSPVITPNKDGYTFTPVDRSYTNVNAAISNANFTIQAAGPVVPPAILVSPADGSTGLGFGLVNLDWEMPVEAASPQGYKVYFDSFSPPTTILTNITNPSTTSYDVFSLNETQTYYWQVVPYIGATNAANCPVWSFTTRSEINPNPATNPIPVNGTTINASSFPYEQNLQWSPPSTGVSPTSYKLSWNGGEPYDVGNVYTTSVTINSAGTYNWQIIPYYYDDGTLSVRAGDPLPARMGCPQNDRGDAVGCPIWSFTIMQAQPMIEEFSNFTGFGLVQVGEFSGYDIMEVSGSNLIGNIIITPPEGFKISTDPNSGYGVSIGLVPDGGTVPNTIIYVRFFPTVPGLASGNIIIASLGAMTLYRELDGTGYDVPVVTNPTYSNVTQTRANLGGNITSINYSTVTERGIYWSTTSGFADGEGDMVSETGSFGTGP
ncbi:MAG: hypothetical protein FJ041_07995, partial [Candidatus Cloacimonetes bacterium]|nr:hypothetical protein [Candidatus Cloacimonadota bacterium]